MLNSGLPHNSMDAKEEILNRCIKDQTGGLTLSWGSCIKAMDEYAYKKAEPLVDFINTHVLNYSTSKLTAKEIQKLARKTLQIFENATNRSKGIKNE